MTSICHWRLIRPLNYRNAEFHNYSRQCCRSKSEQLCLMRYTMTHRLGAMIDRPEKVPDGIQPPCAVRASVPLPNSEATFVDNRTIQTCTRNGILFVVTYQCDRQLTDGSNWHNVIRPKTMVNKSRPKLTAKILRLP